MRDSQGTVSREIPMTDDMRELLILHRQKFIGKHGRPPDQTIPFLMSQWNWSSNARWRE